MIAPPENAIAMAREAALRSPCAKSRRGVVIYGRAEAPHGSMRSWVATGHNGPPGPFVCDGSDACRRDCAKICVHAEQAAIREALAEAEGGYLRHLDLLHVKVVDGEVVAGGPQSCWQCSREILDVQLAGVWLYEGVRSLERPCIHCGHKHRYTIDENDADNCPKCGGELHPVSQVIYSEPGTWRFYTALEFHEATLKNCGLHAGRLEL